ncbi:uncharacterized protein LOC125313641 [Rhodamnia argentea]|uniref:Uncharacterized protein LOC125313641 n=1 Tax=Rhodamnia argentea TaxID=178133 RepID=A0ABM3GYG9_9MYRT|nr:uncharacterized protein LOC125313641 [Rhodamnia argentea]
MPGLDPDIMQHALPTNPDIPPKKQRLRRTKPELSKNIEDEVMKLPKVDFIEVTHYPNWIANIVPVMKKDGRVGVCVDYRDPNKASPKDDFPLPHIDVLVDKTAGFELFSFMDGFSVYVDDMIAKSRSGEDHVAILRKLFERLRKYQPRLNPVKCIFGVKSGKLLGFMVSSRGIEIDPSKTAFLKIQHYPTHPPVPVPPVPGMPLIFYPTIHKESLGAVLVQKRPSDGNECAIYYLSKKFSDSEANYLEVEKTCVALIWSMTQKSVKGRAKADMLAENAAGPQAGDEINPLDDRVLLVATEKWSMYFDGAVNLSGSGTGAVLISPDGQHYPRAAKLLFPCTNNITKYEACILGLLASVEMEIRRLQVYGDFALIILRTEGKWKTRDPKLIPYHEFLEDIIEEFDEIAFEYLPRAQNRFVDALATLSSMFQVTASSDIEPLRIKILKHSAYSMLIEEEADGEPRYQDIKVYLQTGEFPKGSEAVALKYLMKLSSKFFLSGDTLYKRSYDSVLLSATGGNRDSITRDSSRLKLLEVEWIQQRYEQLNMIDEKRLRAIYHGQVLPKRVAKSFNRKVRPQLFEIGDLVLKKRLTFIPHCGGKFTPNYEGPYLIKKVLPVGALILAEMDGQVRSSPVNADMVKKYFP